MFSLDYCRGKLGASCPLEEKELERIRDSLYSLAAFIVSAFLRETAVNPRGNVNDAKTLDKPDGRNETPIHFEEIRRKRGRRPSVDKRCS